MNIPNLNLIFLCLSILAGCDQSAKLTDVSVVELNSDEVDQFVKAIKRNLVFVEGGEFLMGDFGAQYGPERLPYDGDEDSKPLHKVRLSSYSIDKFKVTNKNFQFYLDYKG